MVRGAAPDHKCDKTAHSKRPGDGVNLRSLPGKFATADDVRTALASQDTGELMRALNTLGNQLTIQTNEVFASQDERLLLAKAWLEKSPGAQDIFSIIDKKPQLNPSLLALCLTILSSLLNLISAHFIYHVFGDAVIKNLLWPHHMRRLNSSLSGTNYELMLSTLKLFNAMSTFAGGVKQRSVMDGFSWSHKPLQNLLLLRRTGKGIRDVNLLVRPDVRTLAVSFILSFLSKSTPTPIKLSLLDQHRDIFLLVFKGICQDPYSVTRRILEVCWEGVWEDPKIKRTLKIGLFNEPTLHHLLKLYGRDTPEDDMTDHIPADLIHHFMLAMATRPGVGICFKDRGWYPRDHTFDESAMKTVGIDDGDDSKFQGGKIYNKILANILKGLKINEDARQQELALKILEACPELVAGYWDAINLTLEPRLSSRWITNISILRTIISLPVPTFSFFLPHSTYHDPSPPPLAVTLANILPPVFTKGHLTKGLQSSSTLVQHCTALTLSKSLMKLHNVITTFRETAQTLREDEVTGQWLKRSLDLESEVEKRVPDFMVIISMVQQKHLVPMEQSNAKTALLMESALRLLWLYHKSFPRLMAEVKFDVGKLLLSVVEPTIEATKDDHLDTDKLVIREQQTGFDIVCQLHVLRLLRESEQFVWLNRTGSSHSYLHTLLTLWTRTPHPAIRGATSDLLLHLLSSSLLFSHDPPELSLWLGALPLTRRAPHATALDGTRLLDESAGVLAFLDDCIQRCSKTPYRYLEESRALLAQISSGENSSEDVLLTRSDSSTILSPLLMTIFEQLRAKSAANLLSPSDTLAIVTFIRKLIYSMTCKMSDLRGPWVMHSKLADILSIQNATQNLPMMRDAIKRECDLLSHTLHFIEDPVPHDPVQSHSIVLEFLKRIEKTAVASSHVAASYAAYEVVDWIRLVHPHIHPNEINRLLAIILRSSPAAAKEFFYQLDPQQGQLWSCRGDNWEGHVLFEWAYLHSTPAQISQTSLRDCLVSLFFSNNAWGASLKHKISIIMHRLAVNDKGDGTSVFSRQAGLSLLASIILQGFSQCTEPDLNTLKRSIFVDSKPIRELCCSCNISSTDLAEISALVRISLDPHIPFDNLLALEYCDYWIAQARRVADLQYSVLASPWIKFMSQSGVIRYLDIVLSAAEGGHRFTDSEQNAVNVILDALACFRTTPQLLAELQNRTHGLLVVRSYIDQRSSLDALLLLIVEAGLPLGYNALLLSVAEFSTVADVTLSAEARWKSRDNRLWFDAALTSPFLHSKDWSETTARIMSGAIYRTPSIRRNFGTWLSNSEPPQGSQLAIVAIPLRAFLDVMLIQGEDENKGGGTSLPDPWFLALARYLIQNQNPHEDRALCASCIHIVFEASPSRRIHYSNYLSKEVRNAHGGVMDSPFLELIRHLCELDAAPVAPLLNEMGDNALEWMASRFSNGMLLDDDLLVVEELSAVVSHMKPKPHFVEPVLKAGIQNCLHVPRIIRCAVTLLSNAHVKPAAVNRLLQNIVQHPHLSRVTDPCLLTREPTMKLLHTLFHLYPTNTCQPSHVTPLTRLYGGTLSYSDRLLLSIFHLYEKQRRMSIASVFQHWSPSPTGPPSQDVLEAIASLDPSRVFRTCTTYPTRRQLNVTVVGDTGVRDESLYDPLFLTLLVVQMLSEHKQLRIADWVRVFRSNVISLVMCVLTSRDQAFRVVGVSTLGGVLRRLEGADFLEQSQVMYIMNILRDLLPLPSSASATPRLPTNSVMLLAHALRSTFYPSSFLYPLISRFLLQRPELDTTDVPMLYSLLYSSGDGGWTKQRAWMVRFLTDAMREGGAQDWAVLKRRHVWDLVASMWQATKLEERPLRRLILAFLGNLSSNPHAITSLILHSSLVSWIEMQLQAGIAHKTENVAWVKILENVLVSADQDKADKATHGEFTTTITRCLDIILKSIDTPDEMRLLAQIGLLWHICRVLLRVSVQRSPPATALADVLKHSIHVLRSHESLISWMTDTQSWNSSNLPSPLGPLHHARGILDDLEAKNEVDGVAVLKMWAEIVTILWKVLMSLGECNGSSECWDALTCRLLVVRASPLSLNHSRGSGVDFGEWARKEAVACLLAGSYGHSKL